MALQVSGTISNPTVFDYNCGLLKLYDWVLSLPREVEYIWRASWNWSKVLYLLTRYIPFITIALVFRSELSPRPFSPSWMKFRYDLPCRCPLSFGCIPT